MDEMENQDKIELDRAMIERLVDSWTRGFLPVQADQDAIAALVKRREPRKWVAESRFATLSQLNDLVACRSSCLDMAASPMESEDIRVRVTVEELL